MKLFKPYYEESGITIYCGDCREILHNLEEVDLVLTDPTYKKEDTNYASRNRGKKFLKGIITESKDWGKIVGSDEIFYPQFLLRFPKIILWGANYYADKLPPSSKWLVWDKRKEVPSDDNADCEMAWTNLGGVTRVYRQLWKGICREGEENIAISGSKLHPFQKPVSLMEWCILQADPVRVILDPFMGSGSTIRAAKNLARRVIGIEIEQKYCDVTIERLRQEVLPLNK